MVIKLKKTKIYFITGRQKKISTQTIHPFCYNFAPLKNNLFKTILKGYLLSPYYVYKIFYSIYIFYYGESSKYHQLLPSKRCLFLQINSKKQ